MYFFIFVDRSRWLCVCVYDFCFKFAYNWPYYYSQVGVFYFSSINFIVATLYNSIDLSKKYLPFKAKRISDRLQLLILSSLSKVTLFFFYVWLFEYRFFPHTKKTQPLRIWSYIVRHILCVSLVRNAMCTVYKMMSVYVNGSVESHMETFWWVHACLCASMFICYTIGKMKESSGVWMDGWMDMMVVLFVFLLCARAKNGTLEIQIQCHSWHNILLQSKIPVWSFFRFGRRLSMFRCLNLRKTNKYICNTLFTSNTTIRRTYILVACDSGNWIIRSISNSISIGFTNLRRFSLQFSVKNVVDLTYIFSLLIYLHLKHVEHTCCIWSIVVEFFPSKLNSNILSDKNSTYQLWQQLMLNTIRYQRLRHFLWWPMPNSFVTLGFQIV